MRTIGRALRTLFIVALLGGIASAIAAAFARQRITGCGEAADDEIDLVAIYDSLQFTSYAPSLRHAAVTAWYGGATVDLRAATLDPAGATFNVRAIFGGARLVVPASWPVVLAARGVFGGAGDVRSKDEVDASLPTLTVKGWAAFGGLAVVSEAPDLDGQDWLEAPQEELAAAPA